MAISVETTRKVAAIIMEEIEKDSALKILRRLRAIDGGDSYNFSIHNLIVEIEWHHGVGKGR